MNNIIRKGDRGPLVGSLQKQLSRLGYSITADGIFGQQTEDIIKHFQKAAELIPDGIVGAKTVLEINFRLEHGWKVPLKQEASQAALSENDIASFANRYGLEIAAVKAVCEVESRGRGFKNGKIIILFEGHVFWRQLKKQGINPANHVKGNENILHSGWTRQFYKFDQYMRLDKAKKINRNAALESASYGLFQVMGFHWKSLGFESVTQFVEYMEANEANQLEVFGRFIKVNKLLGHLQNKDWAKFARGYNGPGYKVNKYDVKMANAYKRHK